MDWYRWRCVRLLCPYSSCNSSSVCRARGEGSIYLPNLLLVNISILSRYFVKWQPVNDYRMGWYRRWVGGRWRWSCFHALSLVEIKFQGLIPLLVCFRGYLYDVTIVFIGFWGKIERELAGEFTCGVNMLLTVLFLWKPLAFFTWKMDDLLFSGFIASSSPILLTF